MVHDILEKAGDKGLSEQQIKDEIEKIVPDYRSQWDVGAALYWMVRSNNSEICKLDNGNYGLVDDQGKLALQMIRFYYSDSKQDDWKRDFIKECHLQGIISNQKQTAKLCLCRLKNLLNSHRIDKKTFFNAAELVLGDYAMFIRYKTDEFLKEVKLKFGDRQHFDEALQTLKEETPIGNRLDLIPKFQHADIKQKLRMLNFNV